jgi:hypothetical protein
VTRRQHLLGDARTVHECADTRSQVPDHVVRTPHDNLGVIARHFRLREYHVLVAATPYREAAPLEHDDAASGGFIELQARARHAVDDSMAAAETPALSVR